MAVRDARVAKRYAAALFRASQQEGVLDAVEQELHSLHNLIHETPTLKEFWLSPLLPAPLKSELLARTLGKELHPLTVRFLQLLIAKRREPLLETVYNEFLKLCDRARHLLRVEAVFAIPPTLEEQQMLQESLKRYTGENVELRVRVDPEILGGVMLRLQDTILDGSVRGSLERLRERFVQKT